MAPQYQALPDGRMHFAYGPIDLVIQAEGNAAAVQFAHDRARQRFAPLLSELVAELDELRHPVGNHTSLTGEVARRMWHACYPYRANYITPMAAVAGAVAEEIVACYAMPDIARAAINNGGDIALHLGQGESFRIGICADLHTATVDAIHRSLTPEAQVTIDATQPVRGIATSGWRGRSFSLGIADAVTVLAATAAQADAAATVIANAVNIEDPRIQRVPANALKDDTDLGELLVTVDVPQLDWQYVDLALQRGYQKAQQLQEEGLIWSALLYCQGQAQSLAPPLPHCTPANPVMCTLRRDAVPLDMYR